MTMKDIARELGISVSTVSRALKDSPRISAERRAMIQQYAREHNFTPNVLAESLRRSKVQPIKVIGVIIPEFTHFYFLSSILMFQFSIFNILSLHRKNIRNGVMTPMMLPTHTSDRKC